MGRRLLIVNVLILLGIVALAQYVTGAWRTFEETQNLGSLLSVAGSDKVKEVTIKVPPPGEPPLAYPNFTVIPERDLFMPERRPAPPPEEVKVEVAPKLAKNPSLNGVLNSGGKKQALVTVFEGNNPKGTSRVVGVGDDIQGYTVAEIADTTLKMRWKDRDEILIDMFDATPQQQAAVAARSASAAVTVITIGSAAAAVETSESTEPPPGERRGGLEVAVTGNQGGSAGQRGAGQGIRQGQMGAGSIGGGMVGGSMGAGGTGSVPFTSGTRRRR